MSLEYIAVDPGATRKVATDQITQGSDVIDLQVVKLAFGADGVLDAVVDELTPLPVDLRHSNLSIVATPTVSTSPAYSSGDLIGTKLTLANAARIAGGSGYLRSLVLTDKAKQSAQIDVVFFRTDPSNTTFTDNAALVVNATDLLTIVGHVSIVTADWCAFNANSVATKAGLGLEYQLVGTSLYACLVSRGTPTYTSTSDLQLTIKVEPD